MICDLSHLVQSKGGLSFFKKKRKAVLSAFIWYIGSGVYYVQRRCHRTLQTRFEVDCVYIFVKRYKVGQRVDPQKLDGRFNM